MTLVLVLLGLLMGYGAFKSMPLVGFLAGMFSLAIVIGVMLSAVFGQTGFLNFFFNNQFMLRVTQFLSSFVVGSVIALFL